MSKKYDSDFCGNLPLNFINSIQSYGFLFVLNPQLNIIQVSENLQLFLGEEVGFFLNKNFDVFLNELFKEEVIDLLRSGKQNNIPFNFSMMTKKGEVSLLGIVHVHEKYLLLEVEENKTTNLSNFVFRNVKEVISQLKNCTSTQEVLSTAAIEIKKLSGFDKVMIYQFDTDWNGLVVAEAKEHSMDAYIGLHFPASDVPKQARELYFKNPYRFIPDRSYKPEKLFPVLNPVTFSYTDLSDCNLRAVAPVHLEYLANMGVETSMSTPIIKEDKLWGLISCHHKTSKMLSYEVRTAFELISELISVQLTGKEQEARLLNDSRMKEIQADIVRKIRRDNNISNSLLGPSPNILDLLELSGCSIVFKDKITSTGKVPSDNFIHQVIFTILMKKENNITYYDSFSELDPEGAEKEKASGLIAIPINDNKGGFILGFREEVVKTVKWGGNPNEAIQFEENKNTYHPRNSFSIWKETFKDTSLSWNSETIRAAEVLRISLNELEVK